MHTNSHRLNPSHRSLPIIALASFALALLFLGILPAPGLATTGWATNGPFGGANGSYTGDVLTVATTPGFATDKTIFAGTLGSGVFKSIDGGATWTKRNSGITYLCINAFAISPGFAADNTIIAGSNGAFTGVFLSTDGSFNWHLPLTHPDSLVHSLAISPGFVSDGTVFAGIGLDGGVYKSLNQGANWSKLNNTLADKTVDSLAISPAYAVDSTIFAGTDGSGVYKSTDGGAIWNPVNTGLTNLDVEDVATSPGFTSDNTVFAGTTGGGGVYKSTDGGAHWSPINAGLSFPGMIERKVTCLSLSPGYGSDHTIFAGMEGGGVFKSINGGTTWSAMNTGLAGTETHVYDIALPPDFASTGTVVAAIFHSVYVYTPAPDDLLTPFREKWNALTGAPGKAKNTPQVIAGGKYQDFDNGRLYWNQSLGSGVEAVKWVHGAILTKYIPASVLGLPVSDEYDVPGYPGARESDFANGKIYWVPGSGTFALVPDPVQSKYFNAPGGGPAAYGLPISDMYYFTGGWAQNFQRAIITQSSTPSPTRAVTGGIMVKYKKLGGPAGPYGPATSDEIDVVGVPGARESDFPHGKIYWSPAGAFGMEGAIISRYLIDGAEAAHGLPTSDAYPAWSGYAQNTTGSIITWSSSLGAHLVRGGIMAKYQMLGGPAGALHLITNEEHSIAGVPGSPDAVEADFQNGQVFWSSKTGSHPVNGGIYTKYMSINGPLGRLGLPISDEYDIALPGGGRREAFQHGFITWGAWYGTWVDYT